MHIDLVMYIDIYTEFRIKQICCRYSYSSVFAFLTLQCSFQNSSLAHVEAFYVYQIHQVGCEGERLWWESNVLISLGIAAPHKENAAFI